MNYTVGFVGVGMLLIVGAGVTAAQQKPIAIIGQGRTTCSAWIKTVAPPAVVHADQVAWSLGYLSAVASTAPGFKPTTEEYVRGWMQGFCNNNPNATLAAATQTLAEDLQE